jgi:hypothetical protein
MDKILKSEKLKGYEIRTVEHDGAGSGVPNWIDVAAYTPKGEYIGTPELASWLVDEMGIVRFEKIMSRDNKVSIGQDSEGNWYGWVWSKVRKFSIGDTVEHDDWALNNYLPSGFVAETDEDARRMAVAYVRSNYL